MASKIVNITCEVCDEVFQTRDYAPKRPTPRFCSRQCWLATWNTPERNAQVARDSAAKQHEMKAGTGDGKAYPKLHGRHAHRAMAELILGRPLLPGEIVHHEDEDRTNWDPGNLVVYPSQSAHMKAHWAKKRGE